MSDRRADWEDDRLDAAFAARTATRTAPKDIEQLLMGQLRSRPQRPTAWHPLRFVTAAGVLVALGLGVLVAQTISPRPSVAAIPSAAASELQALGLVVMTPAEAAGVRDRGPDDREVAVHGWFRLAPVAPGSSCAPVLRSPVNPALPQRCGETGQRIVEAVPDAAPESTSAVNPSASNGGPTAIRPLFPMLDQSALTVAAGRSEAPGVEIVAIGHFDDRRSALCGDDEQECRDTYVVDRLVAVDGAWVAPSTSLSLHRLEPGRVQPKWTAAEVDSLVAGAVPTVRIVSRLAIPGERIFEIEPALGTGAYGIVDRQLVWLVSGLEPQPNQPPRVRTILLIDDDPTVAYKSVPLDANSVGFVPFALKALPVEPSPVAASIDPGVDPFAGAPSEVDGIVAATVQMVVDRHYPFDRSELVVRGWFVPHDPAASCPGMDLSAAIQALRRPCNAGRDCILDEPQQLWSDPAKVDIDHQPTVAVLNPLIPSDVPFEVPQIWFGTTPQPLPVVVLGHFTDTRVTGTYAGDQLLVIDQLVWHGAVGTVSRPPLVALTTNATESEGAVLARVTAELGRATDTWVSVVRGSDLAVLDPDASEKPELAAGAAVWIVRRLVDEPYDGVIRHVIATAYTIDGGTRIWNRPACCGLDLATTIDVEPPGSETGTVAVADYSQWVVTARAISGIERFAWRKIGPADGWRLEIARGATARELAVRWIANRCQTEWNVAVRIETQFGTGPFVAPTTHYLEGCAVEPVPRAIVLTFDRPIDLDTVTTSDNTSGG